MREIKITIGLNRGATPYPKQEAIDALVAQFKNCAIDGFSLVDGLGYWKGKPEGCLVATTTTDFSRIMAKAIAELVAANLAALLGQECVLWSVTDLESAGFATADQKGEVAA